LHTHTNYKTIILSHTVALMIQFGTYVSADLSSRVAELEAALLERAEQEQKTLDSLVRTTSAHCYATQTRAQAAEEEAVRLRDEVASLAASLESQRSSSAASEAALRISVAKQAEASAAELLRLRDQLVAEQLLRMEQAEASAAELSSLRDQLLAEQLLRTEQADALRASAAAELAAARAQAKAAAEHACTPLAATEEQLRQLKAVSDAERRAAEAARLKSDARLAQLQRELKAASAALRDEQAMSAGLKESLSACRDAAAQAVKRAEGAEVKEAQACAMQDATTAGLDALLVQYNGVLRDNVKMGSHLTATRLYLDEHMTTFAKLARRANETRSEKELLTFVIDWWHAYESGHMAATIDAKMAQMISGDTLRK